MDRRSGEAACVFHALDDAWGEGHDMDEHDVVAEIYDQLRQLGYSNAY